MRGPKVEVEGLTSEEAGTELMKYLIKEIQSAPKTTAGILRLIAANVVTNSTSLAENLAKREEMDAALYILNCTQATEALFSEALMALEGKYPPPPPSEALKPIVSH